MSENYRAESRKDWLRKNSNATNDDIKLGCLQRIADATEQRQRRQRIYREPLLGDRGMETHEYTGILGSAAGRPVTAKMLENSRDFIKQLDPEGVEYLQRIKSLRADGAVIMEQTWIRSGRPYYNVYPIACESLLRVRLDIPAKVLKIPAGLKAIALRFGIGKEVHGVASVLFGLVRVSDGGEVLGVYVQMVDGKENATFSMEPDESTIEQQLSDPQRSKVLNSLRRPESVVAAMRIACGVCLLGEDSEWVDPDVLSKDRLKFEQTGDPAIVERAKRRGKFGWVVGGNIDTAPHLRRPHLGIRWTGEKKLIPKLVPISGSVVRKRRLSEVPHGYGDRESAESE